MAHAVPIEPLQAGLKNLFVIHGAGGDVLNFQPLARHLRSRLNVIGVQAAGVDGLSDMHQSRDAMVTDYLADIRRLQPQGPYLLAGFSLGGVIAVEIAERLSRASDVVEGVILLDSYHPALTPREIPAAEHVRTLLRRPGYGLERLQGRLKSRREAQEDERALEGLEGEPVPLEVRKRQINQNSIELWYDYRPASLDVPLVVFSALELSDIWSDIPDDRGWSRIASDLQVIRVPGGHRTLVDEPNTARLAEQILTALDLD